VSAVLSGFASPPDSRCAEDGAHLPFDWLFCDRGAIQGSAFAPRADGGPAPWASIHEDWRRPAIRPFCGFLRRRGESKTNAKRACRPPVFGRRRDLRRGRQGDGYRSS